MCMFVCWWRQRRWWLLLYSAMMTWAEPFQAGWNFWVRTFVVRMPRLCLLALGVAEWRCFCLPAWKPEVIEWEKTPLITICVVCRFDKTLQISVFSKEHGFVTGAGGCRGAAWIFQHFHHFASASHFSRNTCWTRVLQAKSFATNASAAVPVPTSAKALKGGNDRNDVISKRKSADLAA